MSLFRRKVVPLRRGLVVLRNTPPVCVQNTQIILRISISLFGKRTPFTKSSFEITTLISSKSFLVISTQTRSHTFKKNGKGLVSDSDQVLQTHGFFTANISLAP